MSAMQQPHTLITRSLRGMNSDLRLTVRPRSGAPADRDAVEAALDACATWLDAFERTCSRFQPDSELCALNASAGVPFVASPDLFAVVCLAMGYREHTGGLFDPTILPALRAAGYTRSFDEIAHREVGLGNAESRWNAEIAETEAEHTEINAKDAKDAKGAREIEGTGLGQSNEIDDRGRIVDARRYRVPTEDDGAGGVQLDADTRSITLARGVALDLGGIAKGWAADELTRRFLAPFPGYLVDLGGDLRVQGGPRDGEPWILGIADPRPDSTQLESTGAAAGQPVEAYVGGLAVTRGGVATSGDARRWWLQEGARQHHLIDPRTGRPAAPAATDPDARVLTYTALAHTTAEADVLAKVAFLLGYPGGLRRLTCGAECAGVAVFASGRVEASANVEEYLHALPARSAAAR